jgi:YidC/Oxa1 family membrane protein insertase
VLSTNFLVHTTIRLENRSKEPLALPAQEWIVGTATPLSPDDDGMAVGTMWYNGAKKEDISAGWFANRTLGCFPGTPRAEFRGGAGNVVWVAAHNQFFTLAAIPREPAPQVVVRRVDLPKPTEEQIRDDSRVIRSPEGFLSALVYPALILTPGQTLDREIHLYAGPKEYQTLARLAAQYDNNVDLVMDFGWFGFFSKALLLSMNWLHDVFSLSYGWAIIVITIIIKLLFWPLTQASTRSMKRMAALQPQMKAIADKYKDDPAKRNQKTMEFMKQNKVNPLGGCLPMMLQMPVFIGFFYMIRSAIELRGESFLWVGDLSRPDTLFIIPGFDFPFNLLPLVMGATMLWQAHLTPPSPGMDPMQQKIMRYMPLIFVVFLYNFSAGLTLYWTVQNLLTIAQTKLTKPLPTTPAPGTPAPGTPAPAKPKAALTPQQKKRK